MVETISEFLANFVGLVWGTPTVVLLVGAGLLFTVVLGGVQFRAFGHALRVVRGKFDNPNDPGEISHFKALCTALSATVGLGNIAGVAVAIKMGGPGATFWMIVVGLIGMASKYTECTLGVMYREIDDKGVVHGGPMYYIERGLGKAFKPLAVMFAVCCIFASFGAANMFQANQVAQILETNFGLLPIITGVVLSVLTGMVIIGGIKRIGNVAGRLVPFMGASYVIACLIVIVMNIGEVPGAVAQIFDGALNGTAAAGGFTGAIFREVLQQGVRRAAFSNEAGMGSAAIAHSAARTAEPVREGVVALLEPFIDTVILCTMTALVIDITGLWQGDLQGVELTAAALNQGIPGLGTYFIPIAVALFAYSTMISWSYYGSRCTDYLFGAGAVLPYKLVYCVFIVIGALWELGPVINFSDAMVALMIIPNMIACVLLLPKVRVATKEYFHKLKAGEFTEH